MSRAAPTLTFTSVLETEVTACWGVNGDTPIGFRIYTDPFNVTRTLDVGVETICHTWTGLPSGTLMSFSVASIYPGQELPATGSVRTGGALRRPPGPPMRVVASHREEDYLSLRVAWEPGRNAESYVVRRHRAGGRVEMEYQVPSRPTMLDDPGLAHVVRYLYEVVSVNKDGRASAWSNEIETLAPKPAPPPARPRPYPISVIARNLDSGVSGNVSLSTYIVGTDRQIYERIRGGTPDRMEQLTAWSPQIPGWRGLGGSAGRTSAVTAVSRGGQRVNVFHLGRDGNVHHKVRDSGGTDGSPWENLGGHKGDRALIGDLSAISCGPDQLDLFAQSYHQREIFHKAWDGTRWGPQWGKPAPPAEDGWESLGGTINRSEFRMYHPVGVATGMFRFDVFHVGTDQRLYRRWWSIDWRPKLPNGWENLGGPVAGDVAAVSLGADRLDLFVRGTDRAIYHKAWDGAAWSPSQGGWNSLGGIISRDASSDPVAVSSGPDRLDVFHVGRDERVYHKQWDGRTWNPGQRSWWSVGGGEVLGAPVPVSCRSGLLELFVIGTDRRPYRKVSMDGAPWSNWIPLHGEVGTFEAR